MRGTLLSLGHLIESGYSPFFSHNIIKLLSPSHLITTEYKNRTWTVSRIEKSNHPFPSIRSLSLSLSPLPFVSLPFHYHCALGHVSDNVVKKYLKHHVPSFNIKSWTPFICKACKISKSIRRREYFPDSIPKTKPLDLLVTNVLGLLTADCHGNRYLIPIRDQVSTFIFVHAFKNRSEVPKLILSTLQYLKNRVGSSPIYIRSNNTKEHHTKALNDFLEAAGTKPIFTSPYTPEQNGEAKRVNHTLGNMARAMLKYAWLPDDFWSFAYQHACFLHNQLLNARTSDKTPTDLLYNIPPVDIPLHPFGSIGLAHIPKEKRLKLDDQAE